MTRKTKASGPKANGGKKYEGNKKARNTGMFQALKKQKKATAAGMDKSDPHHAKRKIKLAKRLAPVSNEFRNFDERMAAKHVGTMSKSSAGAPSKFVVSAPTFQFNANPVQSKLALREVDGFDGFMCALEAPKDASTTKLNQVTRHPAKPVQPKYGSSNVFAFLDEGDEDQMPAALQAAPAFMQPATFTFAKQTFMPQSSLCLRTQLAAVEIDPDL